MTLLQSYAIAKNIVPRPKCYRIMRYFYLYIDNNYLLDFSCHFQTFKLASKKKMSLSKCQRRKVHSENKENKE